MNTSVVDSNPFSGGFEWERQPAASQLVQQVLDRALADNAFARMLGDRMQVATGTRLMDWLDHIAIPSTWVCGDEGIETLLEQSGFVALGSESGEDWFENPLGIFPRLALTAHAGSRLAIKVDDCDDFLVAHQLSAEIDGEPGGRFRKVLAFADGDSEFWVCERHGWNRWGLPDDMAVEIQTARRTLSQFLVRQRDFEIEAEGFALAKRLIDSAVSDLGVDWTCDLFFESERRYWQGRNRAGQQQYARQQQLGLGWGNHDHHTYRSSRKNFAALVQVLEKLGFHCRERFYAGADAGWGAQVLEQPRAGITIFADVDLSPEELAGDFAHDGLAETQELGTVGLWCQLHGEAFLQAGMHHLECQFDFSKAREQLATDGFDSMDPFTNFEFLKQSFTVGERWDVIPKRVEEALSKGQISQSDAERFLEEGAVGSHLEVLERNDGFKGFNQSGVSDIISKTDPRKL